MASSKRGSTPRAHGSHTAATGVRHGSLPPKPVSQKRTRNHLASAGIPPPGQSEPSRSRPQRVWSRRSASWTAEEDARLVELVKKESATPPSITASKTWSRVAAQLTNRTGKQCRERYLNQLKPGIRRDPWSAEEERILREAHARIGNKWVAIANQLPGRTDNCVKNHWNSMLRKRQRREAALKAAQAEASKVVATLGPPHPAGLEGERRSEAECSIRTGCATPSGASSFHDFPTSGVPSPYTVSSPITPKRDSKLQISTLVAASTKELPSWSVPYLPKDVPQLGTSYVSPREEVLRVTTRGQPRATQQLTQITASMQQMSHALGQQAVCPGQKSDTGSRLVETRPFQTHFVPTEVSPMQCIASSSRVPQLLQNGHSDGKDSTDPSRQVRRSSRLLSSSMKDRAATSPALAVSLGEAPKKTISKVRRMDEGVGTNALAALAAAASSVPPSPLTPESRFSATSRSRSVSPNPRLWAVPKKSVGTSLEKNMAAVTRSASQRAEASVANSRENGNTEPARIDESGGCAGRA